DAGGWEGGGGGGAGKGGNLGHQGAGRMCRGELRTFRLDPARLRALHIADPPLRRSDRAPRPDPRIEAWARWPPRWHRSKSVGRSERADFRYRTPRHAGGARDERAADRPFPRWPRRPKLRWPHFRRHPRSAILETARKRARRAL